MGKIKKSKIKIKATYVYKPPKPDLKVVYPGKPKKKLDKKIIKFFESIGYKWYAQGYNYQDDERDIEFDKVHTFSYTTSN